MQDAKIDWSVMPAPRWADAVADNGLDIYAYYMMVNARATPAVQKAAWKLARFYTDHAAELFAGAGLFVPRSEVTESAAYRNNSAAPFFLAELKKSKFSPRVVGYNQVLDAILRGRDRLVQGEKIDDVLPVMNEEVNAVMNRERTRAATLVK
jgi:ABC-type glycerol-3-phosphate transport system substrate-binding protein